MSGAPPTGRQELRRIAGVLLAMAGVGAGFIVGLAVLYWMHDEQPPWPIGQSAFAAGIVLVAAIAIGVYCLPRGSFGDPRLPRGTFRRQGLFTSSKQLYGAMVEEENARQAQRAAYFADKSKLATCEHLRPVEHAMRDAGIVVTLHSGQAVRAACRIDDVALERLALVSPPARYNGNIQGDRFGDSPEALIACREHNSYIMLIHDDEATAATPWFPPRR